MAPLRSIRWRIVVSMMAVTLLTVLAVGVLAQLFVSREIARREADVLLGNAESVALQAGELIGPADEAAALMELAETAAFLAQARVVIADDEREVLADSGPVARVDELVWIGSDAAGTSGAITIVDGASDLDDGMISLRLAPLIKARQIPPLPPMVQGIGPIEDGRITVIRRTGDEWGSLLEFESALDEAHLAEVIAGMEHLDHSLAVPPGERVRLGLSVHHEEPSSMRVTVPVGDTAEGAAGPAGYVTLYSPPEFGESTLAATRRALLMATVLAMGLAGAVGLVVSRGLTAPIGDLTEAADKMARGDLAARAPVSGAEELGRLGRTFNRMAEQLQSSFRTVADERDSLRRFVSDASHELRTPITALTNFNELLRGPAGENAVERHEFLLESSEQLDRLSWITSNLLDLSRLEMGLKALDLADHAVGDLLAAAVNGHRASAEVAPLGLEVVVPDEPMSCVCDGRQVELALGNLVDNAIKYSAAKHPATGGRISVGAIAVGAIAVGEMVELWVEDPGPGVGADELETVFDRFHRGSAARDGDVPGSGLGLAIVKAVANAHGGSARAEARDSGGSRFVIVLPKMGPPETS